jgi:hypothetical protein
MKTELDLIKSARGQYQCAYKQMARIMKSIPSRPTMPIVSRELHNSGRYNACLTRAGIVAQSHASGIGRLLPNAHPQFNDYLDAFDTALDSAESDLLCKALIK